MRQSLIFVISQAQIIEALIRNSDDIPDHLAAKAIKRLEAGEPVGTLQMFANGLALDLSALETEVQSQPVVNEAPKRASVAPPKAHATDGTDPEVVKTALKPVMERVPTIATIRNWSEEQKQAAMKWAKHPEKTRPEFIVMPKERKPREDAGKPRGRRRPVNEGHEPTANGSAESFFGGAPENPAHAPS